MLRRYYHTLRYLKPVQIAGRMRRHLHRPQPDLRGPPELRPVSGQWCMPCRRGRSMLGPTHFFFLHEARELAFPAGWNAAGPSKLWLYNLHYFDDLNAAGAESRRDWHEALIGRWIAENPPAAGNGWEPYPLSLRVVNWIKSALAGNPLSPQAQHSLAVQVRQLRRSLEIHLQGNHLFANAKALVFAGLFFAGEEAQKWLAQGSGLLSAQTREQILADGGHFELSPMYHALILEDLLDLANLHRAYGLDPPESWRDAISRMLSWLATLCHPDGGIAFFNDAALGIAPTLADLESYAARLSVACRHRSAGSRLLEASGYARLESAQAVLYADVAAVGPDHLPAHGHADTLSFELSLHGQRALVNSGTSVYGTGGERQRQRGTAAHNTMRLDGVDSSEVWAGFRVARRARVRVERFDAGALGAPTLQAVHDGYRRLAGRPLHRRVWTLRARELRLEDAIEGEGEHLVELFFHLHPAMRLQDSGVSTFSAVRKDATFMLEIHADCQLLWRVEPGSWHPGFGLSEANVCLRGEYRGVLPLRLLTRLVWQV